MYQVTYKIGKETRNCSVNANSEQEAITAFKALDIKFDKIVIVQSY